MKTLKLNLKQIKIESFVTDLEKNQGVTIAGGRIAQNNLDIFSGKDISVYGNSCSGALDQVCNTQICHTGLSCPANGACE